VYGRFESIEITRFAVAIPQSAARQRAVTEHLLLKRASMVEGQNICGRSNPRGHAVSSGFERIRYCRTVVFELRSAFLQLRMMR
jgi:hypothetical protein